MTADEFRRLALDLPGAVEQSHMGHPDFRANGRIFATLDAKEEFGVVMLTPDEQKALMRENNASVEPAAGAWGRQGCTKVRLARAHTAAVRGAIVLAWEHVMAKPPRKASSKTAKKRVR